MARAIREQRQGGDCRGSVKERKKQRARRQAGETGAGAQRRKGRINLANTVTVIANNLYLLLHIAVFRST